MSTTRTLYQFEVSQVIDHTQSIRELVLRLSSHPEFVFKAGQFVTLHVPQGEKPALRAYSIASDDRQKDGFRLIFKKVENGVASTFIWNTKSQDSLNFTGPFGRVFFKEPALEENIFLSTGSGLSQHFCFLQSKADLYPNTKFTVLVGVRNEQEIYYQNELQNLKSKIPNLHFEYVLSRPSSNWTGRKGYVQQHLKDFFKKEKQTVFYLCGNSNMIKETKNRLLTEDGVIKDNILVEAFD